MFKNYFKIAWRSMMKNKTFSFINVFGLSSGLACCMLIALYINNETSYDTYHRDAGNIYQLGTTFVLGGTEKETMPNTPAPMAEGMRREFPEVEASTHLLGLFADDKTLLQYNTGSDAEVKSFYETKGFLTDSSFFRVFSYRFIEGGVNSLDHPNTVVINEEIAKKMFGNGSAINKVIRINSSTNGAYDYTITGVFRPSSKPSHIDGRFFMSIGGGDMEQYIKRRPNDYATNNMFYTYLKLKPGSDYKKLESKLPSFLEKYAKRDLQAMGFDKQQFLIPLKEIHLSKQVKNNVTPPGSRSYLYILASIALFTLLIACINFMNLSTARSSKRSSEVGVRKVLGAMRGGLIRQFLGESVLLALIAFVLAIFLMYILLPFFNEASGRNIIFSFAQNWLMVTGFLIMAIVAGLIAGSYPAFYLSSFVPVKVLKGKLANTLAVVSLRKFLVVFQFVISVILIISSVVIASQMQYMRNKDLGFTKDQQLIIPLRSEAAKKAAKSLKNELKSIPDVVSAGATMYYPGIFNPSDNLYYKDGQSMHEGIRTRMNHVDFDLLPTLGVKIVAGRLFSRAFPSDTALRIVVNEALVKEIGFPSSEKAVGQNIHFDWQGQKYDFGIIGVVKDFHYESLHLPITPFAFQVVAQNSGTAFNYLLVHANTTNMNNLIQSARNEWHKLNPDEPFEYSFLDTDFLKNYESEKRLSSLVSYFTIIAILISCLGLFGLAAFSAEQRTKEIGVRKVLGASAGSIVGLLSKEFLKLVLIAFVIASPVAWWVMNKWLQDFAYRTSISWTAFVITATIALVIAMLTISFQAVKAAIANPVKSLRTE
ncbi:MAG: ABC transporter permease [Chitinophagaceae bacterium]|nr:ABC transporter permease [Chitinophagaceae bacterium]